MKKLLIAAAIAIATIATQAASVKWATNNGFTGVDTSAVGDNGVYSAGGSALKSNSALTFSLYIYAAGTDSLVDSLVGVAPKYGFSGTDISYSWANKDNTLAQGTTYDYRLIVTGTQTDLQALGITGAYDYSAATISGETSGTFTTLASGTTTLTANIANWTVAGVTSAGPAPIPEPTSGLLFMLGLSALALRRKNA